MFSWIKNLVDSTSGGLPQRPPSGMNRELVGLLETELEVCRQIYSKAADDALRIAPDHKGLRGMQARMLDLNRGLLVKLFIEIASSDRQWNDAERYLANVLLKHVWGSEVIPDELPRVLKHVADYSEVLTWDSLVGPFARSYTLRPYQAELETAVVRIANIIAKADGQVTVGETRSLQRIQAAIEAAFRGESTPATHGIFFEEEARRAKRVAEAIKFAPDITIDDLPDEPAEQTRAGTPTPPDDGDDEDEAPAGLQMSREDALTEAMEELDKLIGLETVKRDVKELTAFLKVQKARAEHELPATDVSLHTIFRGNPGTGKTTVARIIGRILYGLEMLDKGHTVECDRSGFVAEYVGQTAPKTQKLVDSALDGVLFCDEAYSLIVERGEDPFGREAVQALLKRMEDDRERLVVILAGYTGPMDRLIKTNPGLSSRFQRKFDFPDFTADELLAIFKLFSGKHEYVLSEAAEEKLSTAFTQMVAEKDEHFGNARVARNIFEKGIRRLATRISDIAPLTRELLTTIEADDLDVEAAK